ncbi:cobalt-zinc-cadmium efflux system protein [Seinonella peptonophila]|uniref:Cobalt-zinc-cadmium efflux system protein n=1 Tax=Seinonella peptonophila TaxID=112248 RepID=A0A1M4T0J8_9BACL|nr:cation diffusion facilitator family transporter [Seinonella peptonophila]SHE37797.1 cobalt-zinc-cadmium efflux system protein [Seinonella peptonophila]
MHHHHGHDHSHHDHSNQNKQNRAGLMMALIITSAILLLELIGGWMTNSLALLSDAGHMFSDAASLLLSLIAVQLALHAEASQRKSYGYHRFEIIAAFINGAALLIVSLIIIKEAIERFQMPPTVHSSGMLIIAVIGLLCNLLSAWILTRKGDVKENINLRSAYLHVLSDALGSIGAIVAALLIRFFAWDWADPLISLVIALLIIKSGWGVLQHSTHILMEGTPETIDTNEVKKVLQSIPGVVDVHDLHIWTITSGLHSLSCHLLIGDEECSQSILKQALEKMKSNFALEHATIQVEKNEVTHTKCQY